MFGSDGSLKHFDGKSIQSDTAGGLLQDTQVTSLLREPGGALWLGTSKGLFRYVGEVWKQYSTADSLPGEAVSSLAFGADGALWVSVYGKGVSRFDGKTWQTFTTMDGLVDNDIDAMTAASDGSVWFASLSGVGRYSP